MIKVIVVVSGLALADLQNPVGGGGTITINFPMTVDSDSRLFGFPGFENKAPPTGTFDRHDVHVDLGTRDGAISGRFHLSVEVSPVGQSNLEDAKHFANLTSLQPKNVDGVRNECIGTDALTTCKAKRMDGTPVPFLAAQVQLIGTWTLTAAYTDNAISSEMYGAPVMQFRSATEKREESQPNWDQTLQLANTMIFWRMIDKLDDLTLTAVSDTKTKIPLPKLQLNKRAVCKQYDKQGQVSAPDCIVILLYNHRPCPCASCALQTWAQDGADTDFLQLYRLLNHYDAATDTWPYLGDMPVPISQITCSNKGGTSPRCYPAIR